MNEPVTLPPGIGVSAEPPPFVATPLISPGPVRRSRWPTVDASVPGRAG